MGHPRPGGRLARAEGRADKSECPRGDLHIGGGWRPLELAAHPFDVGAGFGVAAVAALFAGRRQQLLGPAIAHAAALAAPISRAMPSQVSADGAIEVGVEVMPAHHPQVLPGSGSPGARAAGGEAARRQR